MNAETRSKFESLTQQEWQTLNPVIIYGNKNVQSTPGIKVLKSLNEMPIYPVEECPEARKGELRGQWHRPQNQALLKLPQRKFDAEKDKNRYNGYHINVQALFEIDPQIASSPSAYYALYEGWNSVTEMPENDIPVECLNAHQKKVQFSRDVVGGNLLDSFLRMGRDRIPGDDSFIWAHCEQGFYHSEFQKVVKMAEMFYFSTQVPMRPPPIFTFSTSNMVDHKLYQYITGRDQWKWRNKSFEELKKAEKLLNYPEGAGCENPSKCKCNGLYEAWFGAAQREKDWKTITNLQLTKDGFLDLKDWKAGEYSVFFECSDACECSALCPRRQLQRGQQNALVVYDEGMKGYGVRATTQYAPGQFIGEFVGKLAKRPFPENRDYLEIEEEDLKYVLSMDSTAPGMSLDPKSFGNFGRFLNHSCTPNCAFIETVSRKFEADPMIPRAAIYALRQIEAGEELLVSYFSKASHDRCARTEQQCLCGAPPDVCIGRFPELMEDDEEDNGPSTSAGPQKKKMRK